MTANARAFETAKPTRSLLKTLRPPERMSGRNLNERSAQVGVGQGNPHRDPSGVTITESNSRSSFRRTAGTLGSQRPFADGAGNRSPVPRATGPVWGELWARGPGSCRNRPRGLSSHTFEPESVEHKHFQTRRRRDMFGDGLGVLWLLRFLLARCVLHGQAFGELRASHLLLLRTQGPASLRNDVFTLCCSDRAEVPAVTRL